MGAGARGRVRRASRRLPDRHRRPPAVSPLTFGWPRSPPCSCPLPRSACLCSRNSAPGSCCCCRRPRATQASPLYTWTRSCAPTASWAPVTHWADHPHTAAANCPPPARLPSPPPGGQRRAVAAITVHRIPPAACSLWRSGFTREVSELATASGQTRIPTACHRSGGVGQTFTCDGTQAFPTPRDIFCSCWV